MGVILDLFRSIAYFKFYSDVTKRGFGRPFLHVLLMSLILTIGMTVFINVQGIATMNRFIDWAEENFPTLVLEGREISTDAQEPYFVNFEEGGIQFVFSTKEAFGDLQTLEPNSILIEKDRLVYVGDEGSYEDYDLTSLEDIPEDTTLTIDRAVLGKFQALINKYIPPVLFVLLLVFFFVGYFISALFYSLIGVLICAISGIALRFGQVYAVAIYALTLMNIVFTLGLFFPFLRFPFRSLILILITVVYVVMGVLVNKKEVLSEG